MFIPAHENVQVDSTPYTAPNVDILPAFQNKNGNVVPEGWSSLIGIITAIVGNVLISVALNTQRYAHIRLEKEHKQKLQRATDDTKAASSSARDGAGRASNAVAERGTMKRRHTEAQFKHAHPEDTLAEDPQETDPLIPRGDDEDARPHELDDLPIKEHAHPDSRQKSYLKSPYWWAGLILMIVGEAGNFLAYGFAPASIVSPLGVVALVSNCIIAPFMLKERFRKRDFFGVLIAIGGAVTVVVSAKQSNPKLGPKEIWKLIGRWEFETYLGLTCAAIAGLMFLSARYGDRSIFIDIGLVGLFGGYTALSTKGVASMLSYTLFQALTFPVTYLLAAVLVFTAVMQIRYLNRALQRFPSTQVIPTQFVLFTLSVILGSAVLYRDFERMQASSLGEFIGGCALTFSGVWLITSGHRKTNDEDDEDLDQDAEDVPDHIDLVDEERAQAGNMSHIRRTSTVQPATPIKSSAASSRRQSKASPNSPSWATLEQPLQTPSISGVTDGALTQPQSLTENPWTLGAARLTAREADDSQRPTLFASRSEPMLPLDPPTFGPQTPQTPEVLPSLAAHSHGNSQSAAAHSHVAPTAVRTNSANHLRNSLTEFVPGPLLTPLSGSLSAVIADSLRRGMDSASMRRRRSNARNRLPDPPSPLPNSSNRTRARGASEADLDAVAATVATLPEGGEDTDNLLPTTVQNDTPSRTKRKSIIEASKSIFRKGKSKDEANSGGLPIPPV